MKFYDRVDELAILARNYEQSKKSARFTALIGRRRIGKTSLLMESVKGQKFLYLFVSRRSEALLCSQFQQTAAEAIGLNIFGNITQFKDLFEQLLKFAITEHYTLIIDEFQEFQNINPSIFSDIQNLWDQYSNRVKINFITCGSIYSMMTQIFEDKKEPLFGRLTSKIILKPFSIVVMKEILKDHHFVFQPDDLLCFYMISGGVPKYIDLLMKSRAVTKASMLEMVTQADSPFIGEGKDVLISEFGREYGIYFSILQLIASGKNTQREIDSIIEKNTGAYLSNLEINYKIIIRHKPMFSKPGSRNTRWGLNDNFLQFWFRFIFPNQSFIEMGKNELLKELIERNYLQFSGFMLEKYFKNKVSEEERITQVGSFWDKNGENEIDLIALNDLENTAILAEIKRNPNKINLKLLQAKSDKIKTELSKYKIEYRGLSLSDM